MEKTRVGKLLARNMKRYRDIQKLSQEELAEKVGCSTTTIGRIESESRFPSAFNLDRIALALDIHPAELFAEEPASMRTMKAKYEVKEKLEKKLLSAIQDAFEKKDEETKS